DAGKSLAVALRPRASESEHAALTATAAHTLTHATGEEDEHRDQNNPRQGIDQQLPPPVRLRRFDVDSDIIVSQQRHQMNVVQVGTCGGEIGGRLFALRRALTAAGRQSQETEWLRCGWRALPLVGLLALGIGLA